MPMCFVSTTQDPQEVSRTYHDYDGYAPIGAYPVERGWCVGLDQHPGVQHSQKDFAFFVDRVLPRATALVGDRWLLVTLDGVHDAAANSVRFVLGLNGNPVFSGGSCFFKSSNQQVVGDPP
jgi:hypothetical protein